MKIIKFILKIFGGLVALSIVAGIAAVYWDDIEFQYTKLFWEPNATTVQGISIGDSRSDVIFKNGQPTTEGPGGSVFQQTLVEFTEDGLVEILTGFSLDVPFDTVEEMKEILGEEDILGISVDFEDRRYTYLEWSVTYGFTQNKLTDYMIGEARWRQQPGGGEYIVKSRVVCPSDDCPWDDEGVLKTDYEDKDYTMFLPD